MKPVNIDQLRVLIAICDTGSFSAAGRKLQRVQSAISQAIRTLEQTHQVVLFDRAMNKPVLTEGGKRLVEQAREVLRQALIFNNLADDITSGNKTSLHITLDSCVSSGPILESIQSLHVRYPNINVKLYVEPAFDGLQRLRGHFANFGICVLQGAPPSDIYASKLMDIELLPVVSVDHPLASITGEITIDVLRTFSEITWLPSSDNKNSDRLAHPMKWHCVDLARRRDLLQGGLGWCSMPSHDVHDEIERGELIVLNILAEELFPVPLSVYVVREESTQRNAVMDWMLEDLRSRVMKKPVIQRTSFAPIARQSVHPGF